MRKYIELKTMIDENRESFLMPERDSVKGNPIRLRENFLKNKLDIGMMITSIDTTPLIASSKTKVIKIHYLFIKLGISSIFICKNGSLEGVINKQKMLSLVIK